HTCPSPACLHASSGGGCHCCGSGGCRGDSPTGEPDCGCHQQARVASTARRSDGERSRRKGYSLCPQLSGVASGPLATRLQVLESASPEDAAWACQFVAAPDGGA